MPLELKGTHLKSNATGSLFLSENKTKQEGMQRTILTKQESLTH